MSKRKDKKKTKIKNKRITRSQGIADFTIDDCANAPIPINYIRKSSIGTATDRALEQIQDSLYIHDDEENITISIEKQLQDTIITDSRKEYPEILWYLISKYIKPEDVSNFARINKSTYSVTKKRAFWLKLYKNYCQERKLPEKLRSEVSKVYGLRQMVIRALFLTYAVFVKRIIHQASQDSQPHLLVNRVCVNVWYYKALTHWSVFFKLKLRSHLKKDDNLIEANPEEGCQVLQVTCKTLQDIPPLMGMTLTSVTKTLAQGFRDHKLQLGFTTARYNTKHLVPEVTVILDGVVAALVSDWWHPKYPHTGSLVPKHESPVPFLEKDFFDDD